MAEQTTPPTDSTKTEPTPPPTPQPTTTVHTPTPATIQQPTVESVPMASHTHVQARWTAVHTIALLAIIGAITSIGIYFSEQNLMQSWIAIMVLMIAFVCVAGQGIVGLWNGVLIDSRNKMSLSRLQLLMWTTVVLSGFLTAVLVNVSTDQTDPLNVAIPQELWILLGISTTSLVGSPLILGNKKNQPLTLTEQAQKNSTLNLMAEQKVGQGQANQACDIVVQGKLVGYSKPQCASFSDIFKGEEIANGGHLDLAKVQMFFFTLVLVLVYTIALGRMFATFDGSTAITSFPAVDQSMVALLGISHAGYLVNKAT